MLQLRAFFFSFFFFPGKPVVIDLKIYSVVTMKNKIKIVCSHYRCSWYGYNHFPWLTRAQVGQVPAWSILMDLTYLVRYVWSTWYTLAPVVGAGHTAKDKMPYLSVVRVITNKDFAT